ncbi:MAG: hypothetical protein ACUVTP_04830 [Candidatus Fervidibacter sp.]|uniref:hypothetical protein n=1 Tax=Candidatus Fervidibacter sp. TaxID=3100871 RepID=UPI00404AD2B0
MRLWHSLALVVVTIALVLSLYRVREVSAQRNDGSGTVIASYGIGSGGVIASQPTPGFQPPFPGEPAAQAPGRPMPGQPPAPGGPMIPKPPIAAPLPPVAIAANSDFVYIVWGNLLLQFDAKNLKLVRRLPLKGEFPAKLEGKKGEQKSEQ